MCLRNRIMLSDSLQPSCAPLVMTCHVGRRERGKIAILAWSSRPSTSYPLLLRCLRSIGSRQVSGTRMSLCIRSNWRRVRDCRRIERLGTPRKALCSGMDIRTTAGKLFRTKSSVPLVQALNRRRLSLPTRQTLSEDDLGYTKLSMSKTDFSLYLSKDSRHQARGYSMEECSKERDFFWVETRSQNPRDSSKRAEAVVDQG